MLNYQTRIFDPAREYLLKYHDDRETIIRLCRDINSYSKKIIFSIHRIQKKIIDEKIYNQIFDHMKVISKSLSIIYNKYSKKENFNLFKSTISNSVEEMIEAFTFGYYAINEKIMSYSTFMIIIKGLILSYDCESETFNDKTVNYCIELLFSKTLVNKGTECRDSEPPIGSLNFEICFILKGDFFMGLFDLTGEIMRYSISNLIDSSTNRVNPDVVKNLQFMKSINHEFKELFTRYPNMSINKGIFNLTYDRKGASIIEKKLQVLQQSVNKVENMLCDIYIRSNEISPGNIDVDDYA